MDDVDEQSERSYDARLGQSGGGTKKNRRDRERNDSDSDIDDLMDDEDDDERPSSQMNMMGNSSQIMGNKRRPSFQSNDSASDNTS